MYQRLAIVSIRFNFYHFNEIPLILLMNISQLITCHIHINIIDFVVLFIESKSNSRVIFLSLSRQVFTTLLLASAASAQIATATGIQNTRNPPARTAAQVPTPVAAPAPAPVPTPASAPVADPAPVSAPVASPVPAPVAASAPVAAAAPAPVKPTSPFATCAQCFGPGVDNPLAVPPNPIVLQKAQEIAASLPNIRLVSLVEEFYDFFVCKMKEFRYLSFEETNSIINIVMIYSN